MFMIKIIEIREFLNAGTAPYCPEIYDNNLPSLFGQSKLAPIHKLYGKIFKLLTYIISYGSIA